MVIITPIIIIGIIIITIVMTKVRSTITKLKPAL